MTNATTVTSDASPVKIYRATPADRAKAWAIVDEYNEAIGVIVRDSPAAFDSYFDDGAGIWLAEKDGSEVVGCIILRPLPSVSPTACEVKRLYVTPAARGLRVADKLLATLHAYAKTRGYDTAYLDTKDDLTAAIRFYQRQGYEECPRYNDNPQATMFMLKRLE
ncbi:putative N-acetyltransferasec [Vanrija pseudolonga]|uniref:Purtative N-acetyltransferasec n=1 Tax=Vanrija pseudolonga TaxID=143232 RepID=A0AAF0YDK8_9TREE|nr:purtative N-acetyltransferasec [Vanrija pseudolonga]